MNLELVRRISRQHREPYIRMQVAARLTGAHPRDLKVNRHSESQASDAAGDPIFCPRMMLPRTRKSSSEHLEDHHNTLMASFFPKKQTSRTYPVSPLRPKVLGRDIAENSSRISQQVSSQEEARRCQRWARKLSLWTKPQPMWEEEGHVLRGRRVDIHLDGYSSIWVCLGTWRLSLGAYSPARNLASTSRDILRSGNVQ